MSNRRFKKAVRSCIVVTAIAMSTAMVLMPSFAAGPNLLPNSGFESSALDPTGAVGYTNPQPLLPTGWAFEGAAALFDHSQNGNHSGRRMAAISGNASGSRSVCADPPVGCHDNTPANIAKDNAALAYSVEPAWRNAVPVPVTAGTSYTVSSWVSLSFCTIGTGASLRIRWLNGGGAVPIKVDTVARRLQTQFDPVQVPTAWQQITGSAVAPPGATHAVVLLTYTDDAWIGQVMFDDVYFGTT